MWKGTWAAGGRARAKGEKRNVHFPGPPGIGKPTIAHLMATRNGYVAQELNASDVRSSKRVSGELGEATATRRINLGSGLVKRRPGCVIMGEVDGMQSGDAGGAAALAATIKVTETPISCICKRRW